MNVHDIMSLEVETYSWENHDFVENTLRSKWDAASIIQLLAFNGRKFDRDGNVLQLRDWDVLPPVVLNGIRETFFTSYPAVMEGTNKREGDGTYVFKSVAVEATVKDGVLSVPNLHEAKAKAKNLKKQKLL
jgi:hypothetical protein